MERNKMCVLFFCLLVQFSGIYAKNLTRSDLLKRLTNETTYDPNYPPGYDNGDPIRVIVQLDIFDLPSISDQEMQYSLMMLMRMQWQDERLAFKDLANFSQLYLTGERVELVWTPDLYIRNERKSDAHSLIKSEKLIYIKPDGIVTFSERFSMTNVCHMDLMQYPFDSQRCVITILSYAITSDDMILQWPENSILSGAFDLPNYDISVDTCTEGISPGESKSLAGGTFSYLNLTLKIDRLSKAYGSMYFAPFPVFFIIALASFGFRDQIAPRITLCTTGISSSILQWIAIYSRLPPVWYLSFLDRWIIIHIGIIGGLLVYHSISYMIYHQDSTCIKAVNKNYVEFIAFAVAIAIYAITTLDLFNKWAKVSRNYIIIPGCLLGLCLLVFGIYIYRWWRNSKEKPNNKDTNIQSMRSGIESPADANNAPMRFETQEKPEETTSLIMSGDLSFQKKGAYTY